MSWLDDEPEMEKEEAFVPLEESDPLVSGEAMEANPAAESAEPAPAVEIQPNLPVEVEKRNKRVSLYWKRPKSHLYEYNYGAFRL